MKYILYGWTIVLLASCGSSGGGAVDDLFGVGKQGPLLTNISTQTIAQTDLLHLDVNNVRKGDPGDDNGMTYACYYDQVVDNLVEETQSCSNLPDSTFSFNGATGTFDWTPGNSILGNYEFKITGTNKDGKSQIIFPVGIRLKFNGITSITAITGVGATVNWTPNLSAQSYQISKLNTVTGLYEVFQIVPGGATSGFTVTGLIPNTGYTIRVQALDILGFSDGNTVSRSFTTTTLTRLSMAPAAVTLSAGTPQVITVTAFNSDGSPQTIGGLSLTAQIQSGTSSGIFSGITDNNNGTYTFTFTPTVVGTPINIEVTLAMSYFLNNTVAMTVNPGAPSPSTSTLAIAPGVVVSGSIANISALIRDAYNNPLPSATVVFSATGGTSTGTISGSTNLGSGSYSGTYVGLVAGTAQTLRVTVNGTLMSINTTIQVVPGPASTPNSSLTLSSSTVASGSTINITAVLRDANNNPISSGVLVVFNKSGGTSSGSFSGVVNAGGGSYTSTYLGIAAGSAQTITVSVDGVTLGFAPTVQVVPGPVSVANSSLVISAPTVSSGSFVTVTATLRDANSNAIDSGITVTFPVSGGTSTGTLNAVGNQGGGVYNVRYTGVVAGTAQSIFVAVNGVTTAIPATSITVTPGVPSAAQSTIVASPSTINSGTNSTVTATIRDVNNNPISSGILVTFTKTGGTSSGNFSSVTNMGSGQYAITYQGVGAGSAQTIGVETDGSALGITTTITVNPAAMSLANSSLTISSGTVASGSFVTATATLRDLNNNPIAGSSTITFPVSGGTSTGTLNAVTNQGNGVYDVRYTGVVAGTAQSVFVAINGVTTAIPAVSIVVTPGNPSPGNSIIAAAPGSIAAGATSTITATIRDANNNPIPSGIVVTFSKSGGTSAGNFSSVTNMGSGQYAINYDGVTAGSAQTIGVIVDGAPLGPTTTVAVVPGAPSPLLSTLTVSSATVIAGSSVTVTAVIRDAYNNPISSGLIMAFDKTGGTSTGTFTPVSNDGNGQYSTTYTGAVAGTAQTLQANVNMFAFGPTASIQVLVGAPNAANSSITVTSSPVASGNTANIAAVIRDAFNNPITSQYTITFDFIGGSSTENPGTTNNGGGGNFSTTYQGVIAGSAQTVRVLADGTPISGLTSTIQVIPGAVNTANSTFTISNGTVQSGTTATLNMNLRDLNNNAIPTGLVVTFNKSAGTSDGTIGAVTNGGSGNYSAVYTASTQGAAQTITLVVNAVVTTMTVNVTVTAGPPTQMSITGPANPVNSIDCVGPYTVVLQDAANNTTFSLSSFSMPYSSAPLGQWNNNIYSDAACSTTITSLGFAPGVSTNQFYYKSYLPRNFSLTLTPSLGSIAPNSVTITNAPVLSWMGTAIEFVDNAVGPSVVQDDTTGFVNPYDVHVDGSYVYIADFNAHKIIKYDKVSRTIEGWIGTVGSLDGISTYDGTTTCQNLTVGSLTTKWCRGGRSLQTNSTLIINPRSLTTDATYLYVTMPGTHRIMRFFKTTGAYDGWIGRINSVSGLSPAACVAAGTGNTSPVWCTGGTSQAGTGDGQYNNPQNIVHHAGFLYISDFANHRIQKLNVDGSPAGWIGRVGGTTPPAGGQLATCAPLPATGDATPGWCLGGVAQLSNRYNLSTSPVEVQAPNEGFNNPIGITTDGTNLYVGDGNARIVRVTLSTGALNGYLGNSPARATPANNATPAPLASRYTSNWSTGGTTTAGAGVNGFHPNIRGLTTDGTYIYFVDDYHRLGRVTISDGQSYFMVGRVSASPSGGAVGCSSTPVGGITPGWCTGGSMNSISQLSGGLYSPYGVSVDGTHVYVADVNNFRVQKYDIVTGTFDGWIGGQPTEVSKWSRTIAATLSPARAGINDYSTMEVGNAYVGLGGFGDELFMADYGSNRIKKFNKVDGQLVGYVGLIGTFPPTGPAGCVGFTSGLTPTWCTGGGRTGNGSGIHGYSNPIAVTSDGTYNYIANSSNNRIDRVRNSDGLYMGWVGRVATTPTDGANPSCTSTAPGAYTPDWCIGGTAGQTSAYVSFNFPRAMTFDSGSIYIVDNYPRVLRMNASNGQVTGMMANASAATPGTCTISGNIANGWCTGATAVGSQSSYGGVSQSNGIAVTTNYIYIADTGNHRINRYDKATGAPAGFIGRMNTNAGIDTSGTLATNPCAGFTAGYPRATENGWCRGTSVGVAMSATSGTGDYSFRSPTGIWADDNFIYVVDTGNNRVVKINADGTWVGWRGMIETTVGMSAPCAAPGVGGITPTWCMGGTATNSRLLGGFDYPSGMWGDANYVYVYDTRNNRTVTLPK